MNGQAARVWQWIGQQEMEVEFTATDISAELKVPHASTNNALHRLAKMSREHPLIEALRPARGSRLRPYHRLENGLWAPLINLCGAVVDLDTNQAL